MLGERKARRANRFDFRPLVDAARRWKRAAKFFDLCANFRDGSVIACVLDNVVNKPSNTLHFVWAHAARRQRRCAEANAARVERFAGVKGHGVIVANDASAVQRLRRDFSGHVLGAQIDENQMIVCATCGGFVAL